MFSYSLQEVAGWSAVPDYFVGPAFFRGRLWIEHQPQDTFLKLQASLCLSLPFFFLQGFQKADERGLCVTALHESRPLSCSSSDL